MAKDNGSRAELNNYKLVGQMINNNYQLRVTTAKTYAAIEEKLAIQAGYKSAQALASAQQRVHQQNLANIEKAHQAEVARIQSLGLSKQRQTTELAKAEVARVQQVEAERRRMQAERLAFEQKIAHEAEAASIAQYANANALKQREIQSARSAAAQLHIQNLQNQQAEHAARIAQLQDAASKFAANSRIRKQYEAEITRIQGEQVALSTQIAAVKSEEIAAYNEQRRLTNLIRDAQVTAAQQAGVNAAQLLSTVQQAADAARASLEDKLLEIETQIALNVDPAELQQLQEEAQRLQDTVNDLAAHEAKIASAATSPSASGKYKEDSAKAYQRKHNQAEIDKAKAATVNSSDIAREQKDKRDLEKINNTKQAAANWENFLDPSQIGDKIGQCVANAVENVAAQISAALNKIDENIDSFYEYQSVVEARLQGSEYSYKKALTTISKNVGMSGIVSQKDVVKKLVELSDRGIAYNLELRAFLATVSDDIAQTFDVFDSNLMRLIRLQQSDTTAARLGMEASLNRLFNQYFSDTSYLKDAADSVSQAIIDANSQLTKDMSVEFEFMVQKWLGALYSLGMDSGTISTIAQGLNFLGTGNVEALNGNESLQSLLAMSASRAGISYADILTGGLDADTTNNLMKSMIEYLKSIAENTDNNQVTKSAYSNVFGFNISDLTAVSSLSETDIANIHKESLDYQGAMDEYQYQANQIVNRTHISQMLDTVFDNALMSASTAIGSHWSAYALWKTLNVVEDLTGGIAIPGISVMGNMVDLHQTVTGLAKTGIAGLGLMGSLLGSLVNGSLFGTSDVNKWGYDEFTARGGPTKGISKGIAQGTSESSSMSNVGSASSGDIKTTSMNDATDEAEEDSKVTNKNVEENADIYTKIYEAIANEETSVLSEIITTNELLRTHTFKTQSMGLAELLDPARVFYTSIISSIPLIGNQQLELKDNGAFYVNQESLTQLYESQQLVYSAIKNSAITSDTSYEALLTAFTSFASDTKSTENVSNEKTHVDSSDEVKFNGVWSVVTMLTSAYQSLKDDSVAWAELQKDETRISEAVYTKALQEVKATATPSADAQLAVENISSLVDSVSKWETLVAASEAQYKSESYDLTFPNMLQTSVANLTPEVKAYFEACLNNALMRVFTGNTEQDPESDVSLTKLIENALNQNFNVTVTNDNFDTALQKAAFIT